jgi:Protein of unknown function (DUF_B2219)
MNLITTTPARLQCFLLISFVLAITIAIANLGRMAMSSDDGEQAKNGAGASPKSTKELAKVKGVCVFDTEKPTKAKLESVQTEKTEKTGPETSISQSVRSLKDDHKVYLVLRDLRTNTQPGVLYNLYLGLPSDKDANTADKHFVGSINFFNAAVAPDPAKAAQSKTFYSFDITSLLKSIEAAGDLGDTVVLTIVPAGNADSTAKPQIGEIVIIEK